MVEKWQYDGQVVYILTESGNYRKGKPQMCNEFTVRVDPGAGTTAADAANLAERISHLLNANDVYLLNVDDDGWGL